MKHKAKIESGKLILEDQQRFNDDLKSLADKEIVIELKKYTKIRSNNQNRYYWGVVIKTLCDELGYSDDEMHSTLKAMFLIDMTNKIPKVRSTQSLTTAEYEEYLSTIRNWASANLSIYIPLPNEVDFY